MARIAKKAIKIGRPATGRMPMFGMRMPTEIRKQVQAWARKQPDKPSFSEAARRLIELGLAK